MNKVIVKVLIGLAGVAIAGAGGYFGWRKWKKKKAEKTDQRPIEVEYFPYKSEETRKNEIKEAVLRDEDDKKRDEMTVNKQKFAGEVRGYFAGDAAKDQNFEAYLAEMEGPEEEDDEDLEVDETDISSRSEGPYPITAGEFCNTRTYYDKASLNYFAEDNVVADDRDEILENADRILGDLQAAFRESRSPAIAYIRNEELEIDYEISYVDGSYRRDVLHEDGGGR